MQTILESEFAAHTEDYLAKVEQGESLVIRREGHAVAVILPVGDSQEPRPFGLYRGQFTVPVDFNEPLPDGLFQVFED